MKALELEDLVGIGLEGGTLVEYKANTGFSLEYGRATIVSVKQEGDLFSIVTDSEDAFLEQNTAPWVKRMGYGAAVERRGDIYLLSSAMGWSYALAKKGVEISAKPNWLDVSKEEFTDSVEKYLNG